MHFNYDEYILTFMSQCTCDNKYMSYICTTFKNQVVYTGMHLRDRCSDWTAYAHTKDDEEFLSFIDGNGFIISFLHDNVYKVIPMYVENPATTVTFDWE